MDDVINVKKPEKDVEFSLRLFKYMELELLQPKAIKGKCEKSGHILFTIFTWHRDKRDSTLEKH